MSCENVHEQIPQLLNRRLAGEQRNHMLAHLAECQDCSARVEDQDEVRALLRSMGQERAPSRLTAQLRVLASHERERLLGRQSIGERLRRLAGTIRLWTDNLMRPMALPFAGGTLSAIVLFGALLPTLAFQHDYTYDVPIALFTDPALEDVGQSHLNNDGETVLELTVDERGRFSEAAVSKGKLSPGMMNDLLFYRFTPATSFGQPTWGKVTVTFRRIMGGTHIVVRG
jgi:hypothetical protein